MTLQVIGAGETPTDTKLNAISRQTHITASTSQRTGMSSVPAGLHCYDTSMGLDFVWDGSNWKLWAGRVRMEYTNTGTPTACADGGTEDLVFTIAVDNTAGNQDWRNGGSLPAHVFYAPFAGVYAVQCSIYASGNIDSGWLKFTRGGSISDYVNHTIAANASEDHLCVTGVNLAYHDTFKFTVHQNTSGGLSRDFSARITATYMGP